MWRRLQTTAHCCYCVSLLLRTAATAASCYCVLLLLPALRPSPVLLPNASVTSTGSTSKGRLQYSLNMVTTVFSTTWRQEGEGGTVA